MAEQIRKASASAAPTTPTQTVPTPVRDFYDEARQLIGNGADPTLACSQTTPTRFDIIAVKSATRLRAEFDSAGKPTGKLIATKAIEVLLSDGTSIKTYPTSPARDTEFVETGRPCLAPVAFELDGKAGYWFGLTKR